MTTYGETAGYGLSPEAIKEIGWGTRIEDTAVFEGSVFLGGHNEISHYVVIGTEAEHRERSAQRGWVKIGSSNVIREFTAIQAGWKGGLTVIADDCYIMDKCHIAHDCEVQSGVTMAPGVVLGGYTIVGEGSTLGINSSTHQHTKIGPYSMIGANTFVKGDIPPFAKVIDRGRGIGEVFSINKAALEKLGVEEQYFGWVRDAILVGEYEILHDVPVVKDIVDRWQERLSTPF